MCMCERGAGGRQQRRASSLVRQMCPKPVHIYVCVCVELRGRRLLLILSRSLSRKDVHALLCWSAIFLIFTIQLTLCSHVMCTHWSEHAALSLSLQIYGASE